jgi:hypothetical protein
MPDLRKLAEEIAAQIWTRYPTFHDLMAIIERNLRAAFPEDEWLPQPDGPGKWECKRTFEVELCGLNGPTMGKPFVFDYTTPDEDEEGPWCDELNGLWRRASVPQPPKEES